MMMLEKNNLEIAAVLEWMVGEKCPVAGGPDLKMKAK